MLAHMMCGTRLFLTFFRKCCGRGDWFEGEMVMLSVLRRLMRRRVSSLELRVAGLRVAGLPPEPQR